MPVKGTSDTNINFNELCGLMKSFGFDLRIKGSHHIFRKEGALKNVKEAIQLWIDTAKEFGDNVPEPKGERLIFA